MSRGLFWAYLAWWAACAFLSVIVMHRLGLHWLHATADAGLFTVVTALGCLAAGLVFRYYQPGPGGWIYRLIVAIGVGLLSCFAFEWTISRFLAVDGEYLAFLDRSMPIRLLITFVLLSFHITLVWLMSEMQDQRFVAQRKSETEGLAREAELATLRQQLQPHFLFNSLNSISALAGSDPQGARRMIQQLSDFLRGTLRRDESRVAFSEELRQLHLYLDIEKVRFGHRLSVNIVADPDCDTLLVPPLLLQPVVENAIKFGLYGVTGQVTITMEAKFSNGQLEITVTNPFDPTGTPATGAGFGLKSLSRRLFLIYSRADLLSIEKQDHLFRTRLVIPQ